MLGKDSILPQLQWSTGDGQRIRIREDKWLSKGILGGPAPRGEPVMVVDFITLEHNIWNIPLLHKHFDD